MPRIRWLLAVVFLGLAIALVCLRVDPLPAPESDPGLLPVDDPPIVARLSRYLARLGLAETGCRAEVLRQSPGGAFPADL